MAPRKAAAAASPDEPEKARPTKANPLGLVPISRFAPKAQRHLWGDSLIPVGALTTWAGSGGSFKSTMATHLLSKLTVGELEGDFLGTPIDVMYLTRENDPNRSIRPKVIAAGGNVERFHVLGGKRKLRFPEDLAQLIAHAEATDTRVIVLDPLLAFLNQDRSLQGNYGYAVDILTEVMDECQRRGITVIGLTHLTKGKKKAESDAQVGSIGIATTARQVLMFGKTASGEPMMASVKANEGPTFVGWVFNVEHRPIGRDRSLKGRMINAPFVELVRPCRVAEAKSMFADVIDVLADARIQLLLTYVHEQGVVDTGTAQKMLMREFKIRDRMARSVISQAVSSGVLDRTVEGVGPTLQHKLTVSETGERLLNETDDLPDAESSEDFEELGPDPALDDSFEAFD